LTGLKSDYIVDYILNICLHISESLCFWIIFNLLDCV